MKKQRPSRPSGVKPQYMIIYKCQACAQESGFTELDKPFCRFCDGEELTIVSKRKITPEVLAERLKTTTNNMMRNLEQAFEQFSKEDIALSDDKDAEAEFLRLMARAKEFRDSVQRLELRDPEHEESRENDGI